jgi:hypothetical protein
MTIRSQLVTCIQVIHLSTASSAAEVKNAVKATPNRQNVATQEPTHNLVDSTGKVRPVALEPAQEKGWFFVRTALDWFAGESIIKYHSKKGLTNQGEPMLGFVRESL